MSIRSLYGKKVSLETIIQRQALLGGINLLGPSPSLTAQPWKEDYHQPRRNFIQLFYRYTLEAYPKMTFTQWLTHQKKEAYYELLHTKAYFHS